MWWPTATLGGSSGGGATTTTMVCRGSGPICRAKLGGGASSQTQGPLETFFLGDGRIGCGWNSVLGITVYIYILFFLFVFLVDVKLWMCWTSRDYIVGLEHCRLNVGGYHHFAYYKCIDETQIRVTPWCWSLTCVTREFPQGSTGYGGGHKNSTRQMVRLQSHGFGHGLWC